MMLWLEREIEREREIYCASLLLCNKIFYMYILYMKYCTVKIVAGSKFSFFVNFFWLQNLLKATSNNLQKLFSPKKR